MKRCPTCAEDIRDEAIMCRYCGSMLAPGPPVWSMPAPPADQPLQYTHSGRRYLLGYGTDFFGIWDRGQPAMPVSRYPRTDEGWRAAWLAFSAKEPDSIEVGMGGAGRLAPAPGATAPGPRRGVSGAWWLLPVFMGWLGGLIAWLVVKDVDPRRARSMLITGIAISAAVLLLVTALAPSTTA